MFFPYWIWIWDLSTNPVVSTQRRFNVDSTLFGRQMFFLGKTMQHLFFTSSLQTVYLSRRNNAVLQFHFESLNFSFKKLYI